MRHTRPLLVCLAALVACTLGTRARAEQPVPTYPGAVHTRIGGDLRIGGELYRIAYFQTDDALEIVARFFHQQLEREGYPVTVHGDGRAHVVITAFDTRAGLARSVFLRVHGKKTLGFTSLKDLWSSAPEEEPTALDGALFVQRIGDAQSTQRTALFEGDIPTVRARLLAQLRGEGFQPVRERTDEKGGVLLELQSRTARMTLVLVAPEPGLTAVTQTRAAR